VSLVFLLKKKKKPETQWVGVVWWAAEGIEKWVDPKSFSIGRCV